MHKRSGSLRKVMHNTSITCKHKHSHGPNVPENIVNYYILTATVILTVICLPLCRMPEAETYWAFGSQ